MTRKCVCGSLADDNGRCLRSSCPMHHANVHEAPTKPPSGKTLAEIDIDLQETFPTPTPPPMPAETLKTVQPQRFADFGYCTACSTRFLVDDVACRVCKRNRVPLPTHDASRTRSSSATIPASVPPARPAIVPPKPAPEQPTSEPSSRYIIVAPRSARHRVAYDPSKDPRSEPETPSSRRLDGASKKK
jgi:hypothetical protein